MPCRYVNVYFKNTQSGESKKSILWCDAPDGSLRQGAVSHGPWAKPASPPVVINEILLEHSHTQLFILLHMTVFVLQWQSWVVASEALWLKAWIIYFLTFYRKSWRSPAVRWDQLIEMFVMLIQMFMSVYSVCKQDYPKLFPRLSHKAFCAF